MGSDTLVDLVAKIWSLGSATIAKVKSVASDVWDGIKAVGEYVTYLIAIAVINEFINALTNIYYSMLQVLDHYFTDFDVSKNGNSLTIIVNGNSLILTFVRENLDVKLAIDTASDSIVMDLPNLFKISQEETLSVTEGQEASNEIARDINKYSLAFWVGVGITAALVVPVITIGVAFITAILTLASLLMNIVYIPLKQMEKIENLTDPEAKNKFIDNMVLYNIVISAMYSGMSELIQSTTIFNFGGIGLLIDEKSESFPKDIWEGMFLFLGVDFALVAISALHPATLSIMLFLNFIMSSFHIIMAALLPLMA